MSAPLKLNYTSPDGGGSKFSCESAFAAPCARRTLIAFSFHTLNGFLIVLFEREETRVPSSAAACVYVLRVAREDLI